MKIIVLDGYTLNPGDLTWDEIRQIGETTVYERTSESQVLDRIRNADLVLTNKVYLGSDLIKKLPGLKYIGVLATGYNVVDLQAATEKGITVTNIPAYSTYSVAQMVFAHILNFTQRVEVHAQSVRNGDWSGCRDFMYSLTPQTELADKVLGIVGFGKIGRVVAQAGLAFGMVPIVHNRSRIRKIPENIRQVDLEELFRKSDFISLNCPLTKENKEFVNKKLLNKAKRSVCIINTGRGALLNEKDVADALNTGRIAWLGADVLSSEPPDAENPLLTARNCCLTPHMAWATKEARERLMHLAAENIRSFLEGNPRNKVN
jgi:glycerate dehydrogenase